MAQRSGPAIQEELYPTTGEASRAELDDARLFDLDAEKESPFLRAQKRVPVRRGPLPPKTAARLLRAALAIAMTAVAALGAAAAFRYWARSWRVRLASSGNIEIAGLSNVTRTQVMEVMGGDIGRNVFFIPLRERQKQLEQIPWVESASVMRIEPNRIKIQIRERMPVAFARAGSKVMLIDGEGVLMDLAGRKKFSFPVILGIAAGEPLSSRAARMKTYGELIRELDRDPEHYSEQLSEVDLSDPEDVKVLTNDPDGEVLVHLGAGEYLDRFKIYVAHLRDWRQQFRKLESVDLRYDRQIIVNPDLEVVRRPMALSRRAAREAIAAGVKPSALVSREPPRSLAGRAASPRAPSRRPRRPPAIEAQRRTLSAAKPGKAQAASRKRALALAPAARKPAKPPPLHRVEKPSPAIVKGLDNR
ncbi:MAG: FtsQ-type POTRA domain-containing protein [Acidobacteria bacterium]|nr:FtsQ-type POTRA domain-containing protein [Acidobacteriota bacterium]